MLLHKETNFNQKIAHVKAEGPPELLWVLLVEVEMLRG